MNSVEFLVVVVLVAGEIVSANTAVGVTVGVASVVCVIDVELNVKKVMCVAFVVSIPVVSVNSVVGVLVYKIFVVAACNKDIADSEFQLHCFDL